MLTAKAERFCSENFSRDRETLLIKTSALNGNNVKRCFESAVELAADYQLKQGEIIESGNGGIRLGLNRTENGECCLGLFYFNILKEFYKLILKNVARKDFYFQKDL